jgi:starch phosphorylase
MNSKPFILSETPAGFSDLPPLGMDSKSVIEDFRHYFSRMLGRDKLNQAAYHVYVSFAMVWRDRLVERWKKTQSAYDEQKAKRTYYLSLEFLMGRTLSNAMLNLDVDFTTADALKKIGLILEEIIDQENDAGLGNGGLGRLAACFLDSCATLQLPVTGYGIRYEYGMFRQRIKEGHQIEEPDHWAQMGNPWEIQRQELNVRVKFGGHTEVYIDKRGHKNLNWVSAHDVLAVPYDMLIPGYRNGTVNTLRLWKSAATNEFDLNEFNAGSYTEAVSSKNAAEHITMVLYPNDASENGKELRLRQQYFLASASLQDVLRNWVEKQGNDFTHFAEKNCFQLNDTHPTCAVPELMRLLIDEHGLGWDTAWLITSKTLAYTNHTLLPEALERWPVSMFSRLLPRIYEIICEINARFMSLISLRWPGDFGRQQRMSIIEDGSEKQIRMAYLAIVACTSVNGVAALHSHLLQKNLFRDFYELWPEKFNNKTNGVTPRRWIASSNLAMSKLITDTIGPDWITDLSKLRNLEPYADNEIFRSKWRDVKYSNKLRMIEMVQRDCGVTFNPDALFDVQVKRIHEYKRQLLNILHVIHLYDRIKRGDTAGIIPRCVLIGGKAAPGYMMAKRIIKLINAVATVVNEDIDTSVLLRLAFLPDYRVSAMEIICPAADLSEQISTAGKEASGTGNMKFMMNGAITIGTLDGANIEIREEVGDENFFLFGLNSIEVEETRGHYDPTSIIHGDEDLSRVMHMLHCDHFNQLEPGIFKPIIDAIYNPNDPWLTAADFRSYVDTQQRVEEAYRDQDRWCRMSIQNTAASGKFSSDRTILDYNRDIWNLPRIPATKTDNSLSSMFHRLFDLQ